MDVIIFIRNVNLALDFKYFINEWIGLRIELKIFPNHFHQFNINELVYSLLQNGPKSLTAFNFEIEDFSHCF